MNLMACAALVARRSSLLAAFTLALPLVALVVAATAARQAETLRDVLALS